MNGVSDFQLSLFYFPVRCAFASIHDPSMVRGPGLNQRQMEISPANFPFLCMHSLWIIEVYASKRKSKMRCCSLATVPHMKSSDNIPSHVADKRVSIQES